MVPLLPSHENGYSLACPLFWGGQANFLYPAHAATPRTPLMPMKNVRDRSRFSHAARLAAALITILVLALTAGCGKKSLPSTPAPQAGHPQALSLEGDADAAWRTQNFSRSEMLYTRLLERGGLSIDSKKLALSRLSKSAVKNNHAHIALDALDKLAAINPAAKDSWAWHVTYADAMELLGRQSALRAHLLDILHNETRPWELRFKSGVTLARLQWVDRNFDEAMRTLDGIYVSSPEPADVSHGQLERALAVELADERQDLLDELIGIIPAVRQNEFPYTIIRLEQANRLAKNESTWPMAWHLFNKLSREGNFADRSLVTKTLAPLMERRSTPGGGVALALPLSGPYGEIGWKILRGAGIAQWQVLMSGGQMDIRVINTAAPGWKDALASLPPEFAIVGGPLRTSTFQKIFDSGLTDKRPYFAFLPSLGSAEEGDDAWRFFTSPQDQLRTLLGLAVDNLGISELATLHPDEPFGRRLSEMFGAEATNYLASIKATASYDPAKPTGWGKVVKELLNTPKLDENGNEVKKPVLRNGEALPPEPPFKALFLPDSWAKAEQLVPQLFFYDEDRLLILGPSLWAQGIAGDKDIEARYFRLAVFPGAWWDGNPSPATKALNTGLEQDALGSADFWTALGFDFIRFADHIGPLGSARPYKVNKALKRARSMEWSMAPIEWDDNGKAYQRMFLFRPTHDGAEPVDVERMAKRLERTRSQHAQYVEMLKEKSEIEELKKMLKDVPENSDLDQRVRTLLQKLEHREGDDQSTVDDTQE